ncbi:MAG: hypothetical protein ACR2NM_11915 [Bythopirellula sp.]
MTTLGLAATPASFAETNTALSPFLKNMPMNSEHRCIGIAAVAEALLEGKRVDPRSNHVQWEDLARSIHSNLSTDAPIEFPPQLDHDGQKVAIEDKAIVARLSIKVADLYKAETQRAWRTQRGAARLSDAKRAVIRTRDELLGILAADPDHTEFFCCFGKRRFPNGTHKDTYHAAIFQLTDQQDIVVFDPNDPGKPFPCKFQQLGNQLTVEWTCNYRDTGRVTTQRYRVVPKSTFFRIARGGAAASTGR